VIFQKAARFDDFRAARFISRRASYVFSISSALPANAAPRHLAKPIYAWRGVM
jgi:hypothetical protein